MLKGITDSDYFFSPKYDLQNSVSQVQEAQTYLSTPKLPNSPKQKTPHHLALFHIPSRLWNVRRWEVEGISGRELLQSYSNSC